MFVVTGANGFIGSALVWELNKAGFVDILCVDSVSLSQRTELLSGLTYNQLISEKEFLSELKAKKLVDVQCIFHMGACSDTTETDKEFLRENNFEYTRKIFQFCTEENIHLIYASSGAIYGNGNLGFSDTQLSKKYKSLNLYGESKLQLDIWAEEQLSTPKKWHGLRFFNVYGPNEYHKDTMASLAFKAFNQITQSGELKLFRSHNKNYKDGEQKRDFVYVKDITRWMLEIYQSNSIKSGIYNLGYGKARTWLDLASALFNNIGKPMKINWIDIPANIKNQYQYFTQADMEKMNSQRLSPPEWNLERGVEDYIKSYLQTDNSTLGKSV